MEKGLWIKRLFNSRVILRIFDADCGHESLQRGYSKGGSEAVASVFLRLE